MVSRLPTVRAVGFHRVSRVLSRLAIVYSLVSLFLFLGRTVTVPGQHVIDRRTEVTTATTARAGLESSNTSIRRQPSAPNDQGLGVITHVGYDSLQKESVQKWPRPAVTVNKTVGLVLFVSPVQGGFAPCVKTAAGVILTSQTDRHYWICLHDPVSDLVSSHIAKYGQWEHMSGWLKVLQHYPDSLVLDVGANLGQYGLMAAAFGHQVVFVEPFYATMSKLWASVQLNMAARHKRRHRISSLDNVTRHATFFQHSPLLVFNGVSDVRGKTSFTVHPYGKGQNYGGTSLRRTMTDQAEEEGVGMYGQTAVRTVLVDDVLQAAAQRWSPGADGRPRDLVIKMDIEGDECAVLRAARHLWDNHRYIVRGILIEWAMMRKVLSGSPSQIKSCDIKTHVLDKFRNEGLTPYDEFLTEKYSYDKLHNWKGNMLFVKQF